ncbi:hypothetical protein [Aestuariirhabdus sp. LZHN29]|uniref:hypothetical protein n=1 Tax=Aestuariirhabdus sp. LZHN29 TaxID=3417462 RepID=UPI003CF5527A
MLTPDRLTGICLHCVSVLGRQAEPLVVTKQRVHSFADTECRVPAHQMAFDFFEDVSPELR